MVVVVVGGICRTCIIINEGLGAVILRKRKHSSSILYTFLPVSCGFLKRKATGTMDV